MMFGFWVNKLGLLNILFSFRYYIIIVAYTAAFCIYADSVVLIRMGLV